MKKVNYHTHTYRCGHANGSEEEMIQAAIDMKIKDFGISEHIPIPNYRMHLIHSLFAIRSIRSLASLILAFVRNGPNMRMPYKQLEQHLNIINELKEKYKNDITIYQGFEAEGIKEFFPYYQSILDDKKADYLILGHHFHKYCIHNDYFGKDKMTKTNIYQYCNDVEKALETNLFSYLAHPDLFLIGYRDYDVDMKTVSRRICQKAKDLHIPLELNAGGMRRGLQDINGEMLYLYPNIHFWKIASEIGNDVIIGFDAHDPSDFNHAMYKQLKAFAKENNLNLIDHFKFLKGHKDK